jgi:hypothetical protein
MYRGGVAVRAPWAGPTVEVDPLTADGADAHPGPDTRREARGARPVRAGPFELAS